MKKLIEELKIQGNIQACQTDIDELNIYIYTHKELKQACDIIKEHKYMFPFGKITFDIDIE